MTNQPTTKPAKYELEKEFKERLKLYLMSIRPFNSPVIPNEKLIGIVGYRENDAMTKARTTYNVPGFKILHNAGDNIPIEDLMRRIKLEGVVIAEAPTETVINLPVKPTKEQFVNNLKLFCDEMVTSDTNRKAVKKAIDDTLKKMAKKRSKLKIK